jgi:hypothetical protein
MLTAPLWIASVHWGRSIINRDSLWPVIDRPNCGFVKTARAGADEP